MGGDRAPEEIVAGALEAASPTIAPILFGPPGLDTGGLELVDATDTIGMDEKPAEAVRGKPDSSLVAACRAVGEGEADAVVSAGNTGAMLAACLLQLRRVRGRAAAGDRRPDPDAARPVRAARRRRQRRRRPEHLLQFGHMGAIFAEEILELDRPEVRLLSIGEEPEKGNELTLEAHALLAASDLELRRQRREPRPARGAADVVVCDGFTGNVA